MDDILNNDVVRCLGIGCGEKEECERWKQREMAAGDPKLCRFLSMVTHLWSSDGGCSFKIFKKVGDQ